MVSVDTIRDLYRKMQQDGLATGNEAIYLRSELKATLFAGNDALIVGPTTLPIIVDDAIPEQYVDGIHTSNLYILDQEAFQRAAKQLMFSGTPAPDGC